MWKGLLGHAVYFSYHESRQNTDRHRIFIKINYYKIYSIIFTQLFIKPENCKVKKMGNDTWKKIWIKRLKEIDCFPVRLNAKYGLWYVNISQKEA